MESQEFVVIDGKPIVNQAANNVPNEIEIGLRELGYYVHAKPLPGKESEFWAEMAKGLNKARIALGYEDSLHPKYDLRKKLKRLHEALPEPAWGIVVSPSFKE